jgi:hypothetical protein
MRTTKMATTMTKPATFMAMIKLPPQHCLQRMPPKALLRIVDALALLHPILDRQGWEALVPVITKSFPAEEVDTFARTTIAYVTGAVTAGAAAAEAFEASLRLWTEEIGASVRGARMTTTQRRIAVRGRTVRIAAPAVISALIPSVARRNP